jgi:hypothetical protein
MGQQTSPKKTDDWCLTTRSSSLIIFLILMELNYNNICVIELCFC